MISREQFDAYNRTVANLSDGAQREIESGIWAWLQTDEGRAASVAECREHAKAVMSGVIQRYDEAAASLAAQWYDRQAEDNHLKLASAITSTVYDPKRVDETARYQANKLLKGDLRGFAKYCGELGRNDVLRSLNETIMDNVGRDKDKGARFARIPTGFDTCTFCLMLASRGAVYRTRKSAGEFKHFHRGCDCKVVPSFDPDPDAEVVEGVKPRELYERYKQFKEIDETEGLSSVEKDDLKRKILDGAKASERVVVRMLKSGEIEDAPDVYLPTSSEVKNWTSGERRNWHAKEHAAEFGIDYRSKAGQDAYDRIMSEVIDEADAVAFVNGVRGQCGQRCAVYFRGGDIAIVNLDKNIRVSLFKYEEGYSDYYTSLWNKVHR